MNIKSALKMACLGLLWSTATHAAPVEPQRDSLLLEFVQDMGWLEDSSANAHGAVRIESMNHFFAEALDRLGNLPQRPFGSLEQTMDAFVAQQRLTNELSDAGQPLVIHGSGSIDLARLDSDAPKVRVRLENLTQNYLHIAQLVLSDELGPAGARLSINAATRDHILSFIARYPVDKEDANGYLSAMWFIREGLKKAKCADEL